MEENVSLKNRLSEILKNSSDNQLLAEMEIFQSAFISIDEKVFFVRNELAEFDKILFNKLDVNNQQTVNKLNNIRDNITAIELKFSNLKLSFNNFLANYF
jgi:hypothetical protein